MADDSSIEILQAILTGLIMSEDSNPPERSRASVRVLQKIVSNAASHGDDKFRRLPATNEKIKQNVFNVVGAVEFLDAVGFHQTANGDLYLENKNEELLGLAQIVLDEVAQTFPPETGAKSPGPAVVSSTSTLSSAVRPAASPVDEEYERRKAESQKRTEQIRRQQEEDRRTKEMLKAQIRAEQKEVKERPVVASVRVDVPRRSEAGGGSGGGGGGGVIKDASPSDLKRLIGDKKTFLLNFTATWCGPCQQIAPVVEATCAKKGVTLVKVDIDSNQESAQEYSVSAVPTFILFKNGAQAGSVRGADATGIDRLLSGA